MTSYPPDSLAESILKLPEWIQKVNSRFFMKNFVQNWLLHKKLKDMRNKCEFQITTDEITVDEFSITNFSLNLLRSIFSDFAHLLLYDAHFGN